MSLFLKESEDEDRFEFSSESLICSDWSDDPVWSTTYCACRKRMPISISEFLLWIILSTWNTVIRTVVFHINSSAEVHAYGFAALKTAPFQHKLNSSRPQLQTTVFEGQIKQVSEVQNR